jgi:hypothetical protein
MRNRLQESTRERHVEAGVNKGPEPVRPNWWVGRPLPQKTIIKQCLMISDNIMYWASRIKLIGVFTKSSQIEATHDVSWPSHNSLKPAQPNSSPILMIKINITNLITNDENKHHKFNYHITQRWHGEWCVCWRGQQHGTQMAWRMTCLLTWPITWLLTWRWCG